MHFNSAVARSLALQLALALALALALTLALALALYSTERERRVVSSGAAAVPVGAAADTSSGPPACT
jgi:hypothetical protein